MDFVAIQVSEGLKRHFLDLISWYFTTKTCGHFLKMQWEILFFCIAVFWHGMIHQIFRIEIIYKTSKEMLRESILDLNKCPN